MNPVPLMRTGAGTGQQNEPKAQPRRVDIAMGLFRCISEREKCDWFGQKTDNVWGMSGTSGFALHVVDLQILSSLPCAETTPW